jgi:hypothetical protein
VRRTAGQLADGLGLEARLVGTALRDCCGRRCGAAVDLLDEALVSQRVEVAADRHVGDLECLRQVRHAHPTRRAERFEDSFLALAGEHWPRVFLILHQKSTQRP